MSNETNVRAVGDCVEALVRELGAIADPRIREKGEELVQHLMELYGAGLSRILEIADESQDADGLFERFADDPLIASLLVLHGLHPLDTGTRIARALDRVGGQQPACA